MTTLRDRMHDTAAALDVPEDPWPAFSRRETRHKRSRRARIGALAVTTVALLGLQSGLVPMPGWAPGLAIASVNEPLVDSPLRGSLAGDTAWLEGMRAEIQDMRDDEGLWKITDRAKIKFLYAGDVGDARLMLAYVPVRWGFITDPQLVWYAGPAGATPRQMSESGNVDSKQAATANADTSSDKPGYAVVVGPAGSTVSVGQGFEYGADGRVKHDPPVTGAAGSGIVETVLPVAPVAPTLTFTATLDGENLQVDGGTGWGGELLETPAPELGDLPIPELRTWIPAKITDTGLPPTGLTIKVRWAGTVNGQPAALFTLQEPGKGVLAFAFHGTAGSYREDLSLLLPAAGADKRPLAWRMRADGGDGKTSQLQVVGPEGATSVELAVEGAAPVTIPLDADGHGTGTLAPAAKATVTAFAADGSPLGTTPVTAFTDRAGITGDSPATRVVP